MKKEASHPKVNAESFEKTLFKAADKLFTNDQLKTNTALHMESEKIEFKVI